jgi:hypothetical protein
MVRVIQSNNTPDAAGMDAMRAIIRKRLQAANVGEDSAFDSGDTFDYLCSMSGGHVRNLLILLRSTCAAAGALPLTRQAAEHAVRGMSNDFDRALNRPEFFTVLREIDQTHELPGSDHDQLLLYNLSVPEYLNGKAWYAVNPAVRLLEKFRTPRRTRPRRSR